MDEGIDRREVLRHLFSRATRVATQAAGLPVRETEVDLTPRGRLGTNPAGLQALRAAADHVGLRDRHAALEALSRRSLRLSCDEQSSGERIVFGGEAGLPEGVEWPQWQGRPLTYLAAVESDSLPGRLLFFFDTATAPSGLQAADRGAGRVLLLDAAHARTAPGPALPSARVLGSGAEELVLPRPWSTTVERLGLSEDERLAWEQLREDLAEAQGTEPPYELLATFHVVHRVLGFPDESHGDMPLICELCANGHDVPGGQALMHPEAEELERAATRWELLAQFSADSRLGWSWAHRRLYFWIDGAALARGEVGEVWAIAR